jgi:two-component system KDP operon response regulator KdpE
MTQAHTILVVDDEALVRRMLGEALSGAGYQVLLAADATNTEQYLRNTTVDLILLDLQLGDTDGVTLLRDLRREWPQLPVVIITAHGSLNSAIEALRYEVADYLLKPVSVDELRRRLGEALNRHRARQQRQTIIRSMYSQFQALLSEVEPSSEVLLPPAQPAHTLSAGPLILDIPRHTVQMFGQPIDVTPTEFTLLQELVRQAGAVVPCAALVRAIQQIEIDEEEARQIMRPHVVRLRRKIEPDPANPTYIQLVRGVGYRWHG